MRIVLGLHADLRMISPRHKGLGAIAISTLALIRGLVEVGELRVSAHGYDEMAADDISLVDVLAGLARAVVVEDYPSFGKGPCVLVLQRDAVSRPIHVLWGIPRGRPGPAVLVTAYRPDTARWSDDFMERRT